jgi:hypothetical protein
MEWHEYLIVLDQSQTLIGEDFPKLHLLGVRGMFEERKISSVKS